jgi:hypothetical protein
VPTTNRLSVSYKSVSTPQPDLWSALYEILWPIIWPMLPTHILVP